MEDHVHSELVKRARALYGSEDVVIDDGAITDEPARSNDADEGTWVQAWVWVPVDKKH